MQIQNLNINILYDSISKPNSIKILVKLKLKQKFIEKNINKKNHEIKFNQYFDINEIGIIKIIKKKIIIIKN